MTKPVEPTDLLRLIPNRTDAETAKLEAALAKSETMWPLDQKVSRALARLFADRYRALLAEGVPEPVAREAALRWMWPS